MKPGTEVLTQRGERAYLLRLYRGQHWVYAIIVRHDDGEVVDTPAASLLPANPSWIDRLAHWCRWGRFAWKPPLD